MTEKQQCPECGATLPEGVSPGGLCPNCLMKLGERRVELGTFQPRRLRATFASLALSLGASETALSRYLGHAPVAMLRRHYVRPELSELWQIADILSGDWLADIRRKRALDCSRIASRMNGELASETQAQ